MIVSRFALAEVKAEVKVVAGSTQMGWKAARIFLRATAPSVSRVNSHFQCGLEQGLQFSNNISGEKPALEVGFGVLGGLEAVQHLHIIIPDQQAFRNRCSPGLKLPRAP
jgi:hypothetical protein